MRGRIDAGRCLILVALLLVPGCHQAPAARPAGTGAKQAAREYCEALRQREWSKAYGLLEPESAARLNGGEFAELAARYRDGFGFEPARVLVSACQERGAEAIAHVTFAGWASSRHRTFKDAIELKHTDGGWRVVPAANFGRQGPS